MPDDGIKEFWPDYPKMSKAEKHNSMETEHQKIVVFGSRWNQVLKALHLPKILPETTGSSRKSYGKAGESEAHKALKYHVRNNPHIVGVTGNWQTFLEYPLASLDEVDVLFKSTVACVAVEVKSKVSDQYPTDIERGIYQTVKYGALLEAMTK